MPVGARGFSLLLNIQTGPGAHPAFYLMGTKYAFPLGGGMPVKRMVCEADCLPPSVSAKFKYEWSHALQSTYVPSWPVQIKLRDFLITAHIIIACSKSLFCPSEKLIY
jgi:hypothetical protein